LAAAWVRGGSPISSTTSVLRGEAWQSPLGDRGEHRSEAVIEVSKLSRREIGGETRHCACSRVGLTSTATQRRGGERKQVAGAHRIGLYLRDVVEEAGCHIAVEAGLLVILLACINSIRPQRGAIVSRAADPAGGEGGGGGDGIITSSSITLAEECMEGGDAERVVVALWFCASPIARRSFQALCRTCSSLLLLLLLLLLPLAHNHGAGLIALL
jgi:hypothetical protein